MLLGKLLVNTIRRLIYKSVTILNLQPDLIIIDYVDLLSSKKRTQDRKGEIDDIYVSTKGLAKELQLAYLVCFSSKQGGSKR